MVYVLWWKDRFNKHFPLGRLSKSITVVFIWFSTWLRHKLGSLSSSSPKCEFDWVWACTSLLIHWNLLHQKMGSSWDNVMSIALVVPLSVNGFFRGYFGRGRTIICSLTLKWVSLSLLSTCTQYLWNTHCYSCGTEARGFTFVHKKLS